MHLDAEVGGDLDTLMNELRVLVASIVIDMGKRAKINPMELFDNLSEGIERNILLDMFIEAFQNVAPVKITVKELQEKLQVIFKIDVKEVKKVPPVDNIFLYKIVPTQGTKKKLAK